MNSILLMYAADDLDCVNGKNLVPWVTAPMYALMIPENAQPLLCDQIDLLSAPSGNVNLSHSIEPYSDFYLAQKTLMASQHTEDMVSRAEIDSVQSENQDLKGQVQSHCQQAENMSTEIQKWKNKVQTTLDSKKDDTVVNFAVAMPQLITLMHKAREWKGPPSDAVPQFVDKHLPAYITPIPLITSIISICCHFWRPFWPSLAKSKT